MTNLEKLLNGIEVEWKPLGEVTEIKRGTSITKNTSNPGIYPVISGGQQPAYYIDQFNRNGETITIAGSGAYAGFVMYWNKPIFVSDSFSIKTNNNQVLLRYIYHYLLNIQDKIHKLKSGGGVPHVYAKDVARFLIPIPFSTNQEKSIEIQLAIVETLDKFTKLEAELEAELDCRKRQYDYYRNKLLNSEPSNNVSLIPLGNIAKNLDSMRKPITSGQREKGIIPYYGASGIVDYVKDYIYDGDFLLISEDGANLIARNTPIAFSINGKSWVNNHAHVLEFETYEERKFVEYYLNNIDLTPYISGAAQPKLNQKNLNSILIPQPYISEQQRIVSILDKFDKLTTSISEGLPAEIELRRKQYEYYRNKLLSFPNAKITQ